MKAEQLEDLVRYRMEQAHETLRDAEILLGESALRAAGHLAEAQEKVRAEANCPMELPE